MGITMFGTRIHLVTTQLLMDCGIHIWGHLERLHCTIVGFEEQLLFGLQHLVSFEEQLLFGQGAIGHNYHTLDHFA